MLEFIFAQIWELSKKRKHRQMDCVVSSSSLSSLPPKPKPKPKPKPNINNLSTKTHNHLLQSFNTPSELKQLHTHLIKTQTPLSSSLSLTRIASVCALTPSLSYALRIIGPDLATWNSCLRSLAESENPLDAITLFYSLRNIGFSFDAYTCSFVLKACVKRLDLFHGRIIHGVVLKSGYRSDLFLLNMVVDMYASCGEMSDARKVFDKMVERDVVSWNTMVNGLVKFGDFDGAFELFSRMPEKSVRSWTMMIMGFVKFGKAKKAVELFREMENVGVTPNEVTVVAVLSACADLGDLGLGRRMHSFFDRSRFRENTRVSNTLIDMYIKCGCLDDALSVFHCMSERTIVSWSMMVQGMAMLGQGEEALKLFSRMIEVGIKPNGVTFIGILHACSHMGLTSKGREFFSSMTIDYSIIPQIEHYGCMVDLFSRAGHIQEAYEFIKNMPMKPNGVVWGAFLGGCKIHNNIELAEVAIEHLLELDPLNDGYYIVLSNIYAEARRWEDVVRVRKMMRDKGVKKTAGWSSIAIDGEIHEFVAGDETHPQAKEIFEKWEILLRKMKIGGYVPNTSVVLLDVEESEKEKAVLRHSEKLALVYGLMKTPKRTSIRIMKNLRVCEDCHTAFKLISRIVDREIIVRDRNRFHCFRDGSCTCKDYW